ncbi:MAG TPA: hypothetical protein VHM90_18335, partial [Phycisphaerae bacterium]|nr:hypothetical protein [Phycisphaerae bacterium]
PFVGQTYTIPGKSAPALGEIYAYGLRNPWKFSFDTTGKLLLSNVGQHQMESILQISNGTNAAWPFYEGSVTGDQFTARTTQAQGLGSFTPPVKPLTGSAGTVLTSYPTRWVSNSGNSLQTWTGDGSAAVGGLVYHGSAIPQLDGMYIFGDLQFVGGTGTYTAGTNSVNGGTMTENDSRFFFLNPDDPADLTATVYAGNASTGASSLVDVGVQTYLLNFAAGMGPPNITANGANPALLYGFGQDQNGEFYALFDDGSVYQIVAVPEAGTLATLLSGVVLLLRRGKRNRTPVHAR